MRYYLGLDVGGTNLAAGVTDEEGTLVGKASMPVGADKSIDTVTADMEKVSCEAVKNANLEIEDVVSWGIGMPSCINPKTGRLVHANCFGWKDVPIYAYLEKRMPFPLYIENDANCAALGEVYVGGAKGYFNIIMLTLGTGLGSGIILNGRIYAGADGMGAELGHTKLVYHGIQCTCGQFGCAESYCSATALSRQAREFLLQNKDSLLRNMCGNDLNRLDGKMIFQALGAGDAAAGKIVEQYIEYLSCAVSSFITIFRPELILLGGGIANAGDLLLKPLRKRIRENTFAAKIIGIPEIRTATLGNDAGIIGAAMLGKQ